MRARRRWRIRREDGPPRLYEEVTPREWDRLRESEREIVYLGDRGVAFVRAVRS